MTLAWHFEDEVSEYSERILMRLKADEAWVPAIWPVEIANGLSLAERHARLSPEKLALAIRLTLDLRVRVHDVSVYRALGPIMEIARSEQLTAYDAAYLELAIGERIPLATLDRRLRAAAQRRGIPLA